MKKLEDFVVGKFYFQIAYYDEDLSIPDIDTYIYIGNNIHGKGDNGMDDYYFQDVWSYIKFGNYKDLPKDLRKKANIHMCSEKHVVEF